MFLGHFALAFAAKKAAPALSLGTLFLGAQFVDLLWPTLLLMGVERVAIVPGITTVTPLDFQHYPVTHSFVAGLFWACALGMIYAMFRHSLRGGAVVGTLVMSHWFLDLIVHRPDLPIIPYGLEVGLGLWNSLPLTLLIEFGLLALGVWIYSRITVARNRTGVWAFRALVAFLALVYVVNVFGPPPPSVGAIAVAGHAMWLLVLWGYWVDRNRAARG
jgi:hypothetical protein